MDKFENDADTVDPIDINLNLLPTHIKSSGYLW